MQSLFLCMLFEAWVTRCYANPH